MKPPASISPCAARRWMAAPKATSSTCSICNRSARYPASSAAAARSRFRSQRPAFPQAPMLPPRSGRLKRQHPFPSPPATIRKCLQKTSKFMLTSSINRIALTGTLLTIVSVAGGCSSIDRLSQIGEKPKLSAIDNPTAQPGYKPVQMPMPKPESVSYNANSLWRNGSRSFFKDQRAHQIGDLLTVTVNITDQANFANETQRSRTSKDDSGLTDFAAVVTQVLPNGNLVVEGKQEIRVNYEIRELIVAGIVRPEDIQSDNTIDSTKIAQAR